MIHISAKRGKYDGGASLMLLTVCMIKQVSRCFNLRMKSYRIARVSGTLQNVRTPETSYGLGVPIYTF